jgi:hypothetical protein
MNGRGSFEERYKRPFLQHINSLLTEPAVDLPSEDGVKAFRNGGRGLQKSRCGTFRTDRNFSSTGDRLLEYWAVLI